MTTEECMFLWVIPSLLLTIVSITGMATVDTKEDFDFNFYMFFICLTPLSFFIVGFAIVLIICNLSGKIPEYIFKLLRK